MSALPNDRAAGMRRAPRGGPELVGLDDAPAESVVEIEETTVVRRPRVVGRTVVEERRAPRVRADYDTRGVRRGYGAEIGTRTSGYRSVGYSEGDALHAGRNDGYAGRTGITNHSYGADGRYRSRDGFRRASVHNQGTSEAKAASGANGTMSAQHPPAVKGSAETGATASVETAAFVTSRPARASA